MTAQPLSMTELLIALIALVAVIGLVVIIVSTALRLRPSRLAESGDSAPKVWGALLVWVVFLVIVILGTPSFLAMVSGQ